MGDANDIRDSYPINILVDDDLWIIMDNYTLTIRYDKTHYNNV